MYYERGLRQPQIAAELNISQPRVSRLLKRAADIGVVRTVVTLPPGTHLDLEQLLVDRYQLDDAVVVDTSGAGDHVLPALGAAGADYLAAALTGGHTLGVSSWSETLIETVKVMRPTPYAVADKVVQIVGGIGEADAQMQATRLVARLADLLGATPVLLSAPGLVGTAATRRAYMNDGSFHDVSDLWVDIDIALLGIGSLAPSVAMPPTAMTPTASALGHDEWAELLTRGAVGDVCLRYFDADGAPVPSSFDNRLVGITQGQLCRIPRRIAIAGGERKTAAVKAALLGGWVNTLVTDDRTARHLVEDTT
jgi:DNA-binding transcriptional regulator LsrR (DeoR family)